MNKYPQYIQIEDKKLKINTDFRVALRCNSISLDETICDLEKELAIIYILLGDKGLEVQDTNKLFELIIKYLNRGKPLEDTNKKPSMDFIQDEAYIKASFMSDYRINLNEIEYMHWWEYLDLLCGLTENSVLNRVRAIREEPLDDKKGKELDRWIKLKESVALEETIVKTEEEERLDEFWDSVLNRR